jgi:polar amino acid transport system substrate-binding protein
MIEYDFNCSNGEVYMSFSSISLRALAVAATLGALVLPSYADSTCAAGKTLKEGAISIGTGEPAYFPWVIDNKPESGKGFEAAVAMEVASRLGFAADKVSWVRTTFDQAIQPGAKDFDFNIQQYSITPERAKMIDFSDAYYKPAQAVVVRKSAVEAGAKPTMESLKGLKWGGADGTTAPELIKTLVAPKEPALLYNDLADSVAALKAGQIDAIMQDLPTALYTSAVDLEDGLVLGQFDHSGDASDGLGMVFEKGNALRDCVNDALKAMQADGKLQAIETEWLQQATGAPLIK